MPSQRKVLPQPQQSQPRTFKLSPILALKALVLLPVSIQFFLQVLAKNDIFYSFAYVILLRRLEKFDPAVVRQIIFAFVI